MKNKTLKILIILSIIITLLSSPPYFYYQLLRWFICIVSLYLAYNYYIDKEKDYKIIVLGIIAVLFNPIAPIYFGKELWQIIDVIVAIFFGFLIIVDKK